MVLTNDDFRKLEKRFVTKPELWKALAEQDKRFDQNLSHLGEVIERKIERAVQDITGAVVSALESTPDRQEFDHLKRRVAKLERKVG